MRRLRISEKRTALFLGNAALLAFGAVASMQGCAGSGNGGGSSNGLPAAKATQAQVLQGRQIETSFGCDGCHSQGVDDPNSPGWLAGYEGPATGAGPGFFQVGPFKVFAANITPDPTNGIGDHTDLQIYNALKHGLDPGDTPSVVITGDIPGQGNFPATPHYLAPIMPWNAIRHMSDSDLWSIVAYVKHGVKANANAVPDGTEPGDNWASSVTASKIGPVSLSGYPASSEAFNP